MPTRRRTFMRQVGVTLAGLMVSGCISPPPTPIVEKVTCYIPVVKIETPSPALVGKGSPLDEQAKQVVVKIETPSPALVEAANRNELRQLWFRLSDPELTTPDSGVPAKLMLSLHQNALAGLVEGKVLEQDVADHVQVAFEEALAHIQRKQATCYEPLQVGQANPYPPREEVVTQAAALADMAKRSGIAPETVAKAQAALARDMAWLEQFRAGGNPGELTGIEASPAEIEAARVLVALLAETK